MIVGITSMLADLYDESKAGFRFTRRGHVTLLSTCFGVMLAYLINRLDVFDTARTVDYIRRCQRKDGLFVDPLLSRDDLQGSHELEYLHWQTTFFSLIALDMSGGEPPYSSHFLLSFSEARNCEQWLAARNWSNFWYSSNEIMFLLYFMTFTVSRGGLSAPWRERIEQLFDLLDARQDAGTGYWGDTVQVNPANGMFGAAHLYLFYEFFRRPVHYVDRVIEQTLKLQGANGLFGGSGGGGCEDYDGVEVLARMLGKIPAKDAAVRRAMLLCREEIYRQGEERSDGFPYRFAGRDVPATMRRSVARLTGKNRYYYSGWRLMSCDVHTPDIWATYFRVLTVALVEAMLETTPSLNFQGYSLPGWGYLGCCVVKSDPVQP